MDADYRPVRPFDIDNGELDGKSQQECFVLGYELAMVDGILDSGECEPFTRTVHAANKDRIEAELQRRGLSSVWTWPHDDISEEWVHLSVRFD